MKQEESAPYPDVIQYFPSGLKFTFGGETYQMNIKRNNKKNQRIIEVQPYNPSWKMDFEIEAKKFEIFIKTFL